MQSLLSDLNKLRSERDVKLKELENLQSEVSVLDKEIMKLEKTYEVEDLKKKLRSSGLDLSTIMDLFLSDVSVEAGVCHVFLSGLDAECCKLLRYSRRMPIVDISFKTVNFAKEFGVSTFNATAVRRVVFYILQMYYDSDRDILDVIRCSSRAYVSLSRDNEVIDFTGKAGKTKVSPIFESKEGNTFSMSLSGLYGALYFMKQVMGHCGFSDDIKIFYKGAEGYDI